VLGDVCKTIGAETIAAGEGENTEARGERVSDELQALITDCHALQAKLLQCWVMLGHDVKPWKDGSSPVVRNQSEVCEPRTAFHQQCCDLGKTSHQLLRRNGITVAYEHCPPARSLGVEPCLAHQRHCVSVLMACEENQDVIQYLIRKGAAGGGGRRTRTRGGHLFFLLPLAALRSRLRGC